MLLLSLNLKSNRLKSLLTVTALLVLVALVFFVTPRLDKPPADETKINFSDECSRIFYLNLCGWDVTPISCEEVIIPKSFNAVYEDYNELQRLQGFNLAEYRGKSAELYSFSVCNHPLSEDNVVAVMLVVGGRLIGGDIHALEQNGFMCGLRGE